MVVGSPMISIVYYSGGDGKKFIGGIYIAMEELTTVLDNHDGADAGGAIRSWMKALHTQAKK